MGLFDAAPYAQNNKYGKPVTAYPADSEEVCCAGEVLYTIPNTP